MVQGLTVLFFSNVYPTIENKGIQYCIVLSLQFPLQFPLPASKSVSPHPPLPIT
jgi:hypothetical protein